MADRTVNEYYEITAKRSRGFGDGEDTGVNVIMGNVRHNYMHRHDSLELIMVMKGSMRVCVAGEDFLMKEGDIHTIPMGSPHEIFSGSDSDMQVIIQIEPDRIHAPEGKMYYFSTVDNRESPPAAQPDISGEIKADAGTEDAAELRRAIAGLALLEYKRNAALADLYRLEENGIYQNMLLIKSFSDTENYKQECLINRILYILSKYKTPIPVNNTDTREYRRFSDCIAFIHSHYMEEIDAAAIADELQISEPTVYRMMKRHMGISLANYINMVRISAACAMIDEGEKGMLEIASESGYQSTSNFYRAFNSVMHCSPGDYRKRSRGRRGSRSGSIRETYTQSAQQEFLGRNDFIYALFMPDFLDELKRNALEII